MSGIDEGISFCPKCTDEKGVYESPSHWVGRAPQGNVWLLSNRFLTQNPEYGGIGVVFSRSFAEPGAEHFDCMTHFECGWSSSDRRRVDGGMGGAWYGHKYYRGEDDVFDKILRDLRYTFERSGGKHI